MIAYFLKNNCYFEILRQYFSVSYSYCWKKKNIFPSACWEWASIYKTTLQSCKWSYRWLWLKMMYNIKITYFEILSEHFEKCHHTFTLGLLLPQTEKKNKTHYFFFSSLAQICFCTFPTTYLKLPSSPSQIGNCTGPAS